MPKAIVTGASGFVGGRLRDTLLDQGWDVVALTRKGSPEPRRGRAEPVDYADPSSLERVLESERPDVVFHVAGATKGVKYEDFQRGNVLPTRNLARALAEKHSSVGRFVQVSSLAAVGPSTPDEPRTEAHERKPIEHYGKSKLEAELMLEQEIGGAVPWTIVRPAYVYGPGDSDTIELFKLANNRLNVFYGNRDYLMSVVHVDDLIRAMLGAADSSATVGKSYLICDGEQVSWELYQRLIVEAVGKGALTMNLPAFLVDVAAVFGELATAIDNKPRLFNRQKAIMGKQIWTCRHDRARSDFNYAPQVPLAEGLKGAHDWYREAGWL